ncbi:hypothetical protein Agabi119p4_10451 [Agaricus bisporus var. burnettii]|uniref:Uncharacterized protein n=1 Tax=Agaricus bisporus var. burnettii TaxID=192524 RepID=A0A8H7C225_AGABI|nr:hypothetical protein Agabi119p4_10451 [Agaricus bisporus var. burnettii]
MAVPDWSLPLFLMNSEMLVSASRPTHLIYLLRILLQTLPEFGPPPIVPSHQVFELLAILSENNFHPINHPCDRQVHKTYHTPLRPFSKPPPDPGLSVQVPPETSQIFQHDNIWKIAPKISGLYCAILYESDTPVLVESSKMEGEEYSGRPSDHVELGGMPIFLNSLSSSGYSRFTVLIDSGITTRIIPRLEWIWGPCRLWALFCYIIEGNHAG